MHQLTGSMSLYVWPAPCVLISHRYLDVGMWLYLFNKTLVKSRDRSTVSMWTGSLRSFVCL